MNRLIRVWLAAGAIILSSCDDSATRVPDVVLEQATRPASSSTKTPTTQDLLTGHRSKTALMPLPLTMVLPPGWGPMRDARLPNVIQGATPSGEVQIQLTARSSMKPDELERLIASAKKEMAEKPQQIVKVDVRNVGNTRVLERQKVGVPAPFTTYDSNNVPHESIESNFTWTINVIVPHEGAFQMHELNFIGLTKSQYDREKDFLNSVISTVAYAQEAAVAATGPAFPAALASSTQPATQPAQPKTP